MGDDGEVCAAPFALAGHAPEPWAYCQLEAGHDGAHLVEQGGYRASWFNADQPPAERG